MQSKPDSTEEVSHFLFPQNIQNKMAKAFVSWKIRRNNKAALDSAGDQKPQAKTMETCNNSETRGVAKVEIKKFSYEWVIENFKNIVKEPGERIESSKFSSDSKKKDKWRLVLYPNGQEKKYEGYLSIFLHLISTKRTGEKVMFDVMIIDYENSAKFKKTGFSNFKFENGQTRISGGWPSYLKRDTLFLRTSELLPNGKLTIKCNVERVDKIVTTEVTSVLSPIEIPNSTLVDELGLAVQNEEFCDVLLKIGKIEFRASKVILAARSPVFARMFSHKNMKDNQRNQVDITDIKKDVFRELLHFIYTDTAPKLNEMPEELLAAADKYQLNRLKIMCEKALHEKISIENVVEIFILSGMHNAEKLKKETLKFMKGRENEILLTDGYKSLQVTNNHQALKLCEMLLIGEPMLAPKNSTTK